MPTYFDEFGNEVDPFAEPPQQQQPEPGWRKALMERIEKAEQAAQEHGKRAEVAERNLAFARAGVPLDNPAAQWFVKGYDGELTPEAIKAAAEPLNFGTPAPQQPQGIPADEQAAHNRMAQAQQGQGVPGARDYDAEMAAAQTPADMDRIFAEKHAALGLQGPAIVNE